MVSVGFWLSPLVPITEEPRFMVGVRAPGVTPLPEAQRESGKCLQGSERKARAQQPPPPTRGAMGTLARVDASTAPSSQSDHLPGRRRAS